MNIKLTIAATVLLHWIVISNYAQSTELKFNLVEDPGGKPLGKIRNVVQDPSGYMWFSGETAKCVYRYDGNKLTTFSHDQSNPNSLGGTDVNSVYADDQGMIWIGMTNGLDQYNPATGNFKHYRHDDSDPGSISFGGITPILKDKQGRLWVGGDGLDLLDEKTDKFTHYRHDPNDPTSLSSNVVWNLYEDRQGVLWIACGKPFFNQGKDWDEGGLNRLEANGTFTTFKHSDDPHSLISNKVRAMFEDSHGNFWVGTSGDGLHIMDRKTGRFERHTYDPAHPNNLSRPPLKHEDKFIYENDQVTFIHEDIMGSIWIGSMWSGINRYDPGTKEITHFEKSNGFPETSGWNIFESRDGVLWVSTQDEHLYCVDPFHITINKIETGSSVSRLLEDHDGLWLATIEGGLLEYNSHGDLVHQYKHNPSDSTSLSSNIVNSIFKNQSDTIWVGTQDGVDLFNKSTGKFSKLPLPPGNKTKRRVNKTMNIIQHGSTMWFTTWGNGLIRYNKKDGSFKHILIDDNDNDPFTVNHLDPILVDSAGNLWIGSMKGVLNYNVKTEKVIHYKTDLKIPYMFKDSRGILWAGTSKGLYQYNKTEDVFLPFFDSQMLLSNERIYGIVEDESNNLWLSTPAGIVRINAEQNATYIYNKRYGLSELQPFVGSITSTASGEILIGSDKAFYSFLPSALDVKPNFNINVSSFAINKVDVIPGETSPIEQPINQSKSIELKYDQNNFYFLFSSDDYRAPESIRYFTMLEGYDTWHEVLGEKRSDYFFVPAGTYNYRIRAYNETGTKAEKQITITILPPWWRTWWAYLAYAITTLGLLLLGRQTVIQRERLKSNLKWSQLEREKEREQLEKAKEIDRIKTSFFTNISHEFRTPLTLIQGPAQILLEKFSNNAAVSNQLNLIQHNSNTLLKLINQLLDLAKLESGTLEIKNTQTDLTLFLKILANSFSSAALQKEIELIIDLPAIHYEVNFDHDKLETLFNNLISNAIKFTPRLGRVVVSAKIEGNIGLASSQLTFSVSDTAAGIPVEFQEKIFERFFQINDETSNYKVGTGIGLALVKEITELMKGKIEVISKPESGSEFIVRLPIEITKILIAAVETPEIITQNWTDVDIKSVDSDQEKHTILVVEDHADLRKFIIASLGDDYNFLEADNGRTGLEVAFREIPELIISDVMMPEMDGIGFIHRIRKDIATSHIPVIFLTAKATENDKLLGLETGAQDYLQKPFNKSELVAKVKNIINYSVKIREKMRLDLLGSTPVIEAISNDEHFLIKVKEAIISRLTDEQLSVDSLAKQIGWSRAQFYRKIKALTGISANELIRRFRLQKAAQLLEQKWGSVSQVAYEVGFSNPSYFSKCFKDEYGVYPSEYHIIPQA